MFKNATFRQLTVFHAVARLGSVSRAATELALSQPAVSMQLRLLEEGAGAALLERVGRGIRLSAAGEVMAGYAGRILELWRECGDEIGAQGGALAGTLRIGAVTTAEYLLPPLLVAFTGGRSDVSVQLRVGNREQIVHMLAAQEIDLAIMGQPPTELKTLSRAFAAHPMAFLAAPTHPLMAAPGPTLAQVAATPLLLRERGSGTRTTLERWFGEAGLVLHIGSELSSNEAIKQRCAAGFGIAFLSMHTCGLELDAGLLALLPMAGNPIEREWFVIQEAARRAPRLAGAFVDFLAERGQALIQAQLHPQSSPTAAAAPRSIP